MAVLSGARGRIGARIALAAAALSGGGCMLFSQLGSGEQGLAFDHAIHLEEGLDCAGCHLGAEDSDEPGMPVQAQCMLCHEDIDAEKAPDQKIDTLFRDGAFAATHAAALGDDVIFSHAKHVTAGIECGACHTGIESSTRIGPEVRVSMDACIACHAERGAARECATCHRETRQDRPPASHAHEWKRLHGDTVRAHGEALADRCSLCHQESTCSTCHQEEAPASHDGFWRLRSHGVAASMDRASCAVCHRNDSCVQCHSETKPSTHVGAFGAPMALHCLSCHTPLAESGCSACHAGTPSHLEATPMPDWHDPGMNCRQCHGVTQPLPHVDNGSTCTSCHR